MDVTLTPSLLSGIVSAIPSKSDAHRILILSAFADAPTVVCLAQSSADIDATVLCLSALGAEFKRSGGQIKVMPVRAVSPSPLLDCGESGSTLRFLLPVAAAVSDGARFTGRGRLPLRPLTELADAMKKHGVQFSGDRLPFEITGRLTGGVYDIPGNISSQYITGLLLALAVMKEKSVIRLTSALESRAYVEMTIHTLSRFGVTVNALKSAYEIAGGQKIISPETITVDGDWSAAAFFLCVGALSGEVSVTGLNPRSYQGDKEIINILSRMGAEVTSDHDTVTVRRAPLCGIDLDVSDIPDLLPVLAAVAAFAQGETRFLGGKRLRLKESDRLSSVAAMINALGGQAEELADGLIVKGGGLTGGTVNSVGDHRISMAAAVAAAGCTKPVTILGADSAGKSYPAFFKDYEGIGGKVNVI